MFSTHCAEPFTVESVDVVSPDGTVVQYPELGYRMETISPKMANSYIGIDESPETITQSLTRMYLNAALRADGDIDVEIPPTRHDVIHACDIYEDVAISHGYSLYIYLICLFWSFAASSTATTISNERCQEQCTLVANIH